MTKNKRKSSSKMGKDGAVRIDSNVPFDMLFKYELNVPGQSVTIGNEIRDVSKHLKENKKRK